MSNKNKEFIMNYIKAMNGSPKTTKLLDKFIAESDIELKNHIIAFDRGIPNYEGEIEDIIAENDKVVVYGTFEGIHKGEFFSQPASGKYIKIPFICIYQIINNKIINHWFLTDSLGLMQQIGAIPSNTFEEEKKIVSLNNYSVLINKQD